MFETKAGIIKPIVYVGITKGDKLLLVDYAEAPNPAKSGWWIPAPGLEFGEDPKEKAEETVRSFGIEIDSIALHDVESFVMPGGWHFICHYLIKTSSEPQSTANIKNFRWVTKEQLSEMQDIAHGKWEKGVGMSYLGA
ncbi:MAG: NUDIX hydrolase [Bdellovibrionales bacterium]|nr:NUDIX hydrolase [Bdellovibrionales bacterium]